MRTSHHKFLRGFTLIEMLIVIVIIGILASALIPRLSQAKDRANDTARKAHLQQVAAVLVAYQIDKGTYPSNAGPLSDIETELLDAGLSSVPTDPDANRQFKGIKDGSSCALSPKGQYLYTPIKKRGIANAGFVLMAGTQTEGGSNWIYDSSATISNVVTDGCITDTSNFQDLQSKVCTTLHKTSNTDITSCDYDANDDALRYIYMQ